jgi:hypothetical protein
MSRRATERDLRALLEVRSVHDLIHAMIEECYKRKNDANNAGKWTLGMMYQEMAAYLTKAEGLARP